jgi:hypothetical protein
VSVIFYIDSNEPITEVERSKARNILARPNTGILGPNPTRDMNVCPRGFCVYIVLCSFFLVSWGGVRLSPFGTSATVWPIVLAPG